MKTNVLSKLYEDQSGESLASMLLDVHESLPSVRTDSEWTDEIRNRLKQVDLNNSLFVSEIASSIQQKEKHNRNVSAPGEGDNLQLDLCTPDWAENHVIILGGNESVKLISAKLEHLMYGWKQRQEKSLKAAKALNRFYELVELAQENGSLADGLRRNGAPGW
jgi:hypothetical protein